MSKTKETEKTSTKDKDDSEGCFKIEAENQYPDQIISRLRLFDGFGNPITNPKLLFRDCEVVGFFFATIWHPQKEQFQNHVLDFTRKHPHRFKCIYVSIDSKKSDFEIATKDKAWVHMAWNDGSNLDDQDQEEENSEFISPYETSLLEQIFSNPAPSSSDSDSRPISRVSLVQQMNVLSTPSLSIYHLKHHTWLDQHLRHALFESPEQREKAWETWEKGELMGFSWSEVYRSMKWSILLSIVALIYWILVKLDDSYNLVHLTEKFLNLGKGPNSNDPSPIESIPKSNHLYSEF